MHVLLSVSFFVLVAVAARSSKAKPEPTQPTAPVAAAAHEELALCTDKAAVPLGATSCRLDLGTGADTHWVDSDGVDPGTAGRHEEFVESNFTTLKPGRTFGEFCLDDDRLVESNPGAGECHAHGGDLGHPDVVSCAAWCQAEQQPAGRCEGGVAAEGAAGPCESARCVCVGQPRPRRVSEPGGGVGLASASGWRRRWAGVARRRACASSAVLFLVFLCLLEFL